MNQSSSYNSPVRKSIRYYHKVATAIILETSVVNSLILIIYNAIIIYNAKTPKKKKNVYHPFRKALVD